MTIIAFDGLDAFEEANSIYSIISKDKKIKMVRDGVHLEYFGIILFYLFDWFIGVYLFAVNGPILVCCHKHMLVPYDRSIIHFPWVVKLQ
jgi:hypothetical protein